MATLLLSVEPTMIQMRQVFHPFGDFDANPILIRQGEGESHD